MAPRRPLSEARKRLLRRAFEAGQRAGFDLLPRHFYSQIPTIGELRASSAWRSPHDMSFIAGADRSSQLSFLKACCTPEIVARVPRDLYERACDTNGAVGFGPMEARFLYCFVASCRPSRIVQVGSGVSALVVLEAADAFDHEVDLICIDPHPTKCLAHASRAGRITLIAEKAQQVDRRQFLDLKEGDLLFVDSTHTVKPGSEVNQIILDVLPALTDGVYVHFHDILFPYDYSPTILETDLFFWSETALLHAFLIHNSRFTLRLAMSLIHHQAPEALAELFPDYRPARFDAGLLSSSLGSMHFPSSAYLEATTTHRGSD